MTLEQKVKHVEDNYGVNSVIAARVVNDVPDLAPDIISLYLKAKPKPFVKWVGGKRQLLAQFRNNKLYPPRSFNTFTNYYFEPFAGGAAVFFDLLPNKAHINDLNEELVATYNIIKNDVKTLISNLNSESYRYDKELFLKIRSLNPLDLSEIERASRFIYLNRTGFNGMYRVNKSGQFNVPFGKYNNPLICDEANLNRVADALKGVTITSLSYKFILDLAKKGDFIYLDPPYYPVTKTASFTTYTNDVFLEKQQEELRDAYLELNNRGCFVMLSNSDTPFIESLFAPFSKEGIKINKVQAGRSINSNSSKRGKVSEILVTNY